ncbi:MAG: glycosyltransferase family 4 protein [Methanobacteriaceae archaeon]|jgi:N-acetyl-alpha-D-glucosaminyl L-malate synthase BshA|nr:glycosyltransferase family 4 protein [Methanobacteriaceae archaeon]MDO9626844.1 glycosyltransferase family 4 protein [Methanobacteriaceae archaeon]
MKIAMVGHFPPHIGGISSYVYLLSKKLIENGDEVFVITYPHENVQSLEGIHVESATAPNIKGLRGMIFSLTGTIKLIQMVRENDINLIHAHYLSPPGLIGLMTSMITGVPFCVTLHGSDVFLLSSNRILRPIFKLILNHALGVFVVSEAVKDKVLELEIPNLERKIKITWNGVDTHRFNPQNKGKLRKELGIEDDEQIILFVGNLVAQKGVKHLLRAKKLMEEPSKLVIVGGGPLLQEFKGMAEYEGLKSIIFTGPRSDVEELIPDADVIVMPSINESFGIALLEGMASGKPVVATNVGGIPELVNEDVGILVEPKDPVALAEALDKLLKDPHMREKMGKMAQKRAMKFAELEIPY